MINVTPEMIDAGIKAWHDNVTEDEPITMIVVAIFRAMVEAQIKTPLIQYTNNDNA